MDVSENISLPDREIKDIMSANNVSIETAKDLHDNAWKCRKAQMRRG
jgi:hypothetical protein